MVADDLTPADIILLSQLHVAAFVTEYGGPLSHTAILARNLVIPAIVGLRDARRMLREGALVIIDGEAGHVLATPVDIPQIGRAACRESWSQSVSISVVRVTLKQKITQTNAFRH